MSAEHYVFLSVMLTRAASYFRSVVFLDGRAYGGMPQRIGRAAGDLLREAHELHDRGARPEDLRYLMSLGGCTFEGVRDV